MRILLAALAVAALPLTAQAQGDTATSAQSAPRAFSELVNEGYEVKGFSLLPRGTWEAVVVLQKQASVYICDLRKGSARKGEAAPVVASSLCYFVGGAPASSVPPPNRPQG
jgi:hypothetical protein